MFGKAVAPTDTGRATGALVQKVMEDNRMTYGGAGIWSRRIQANTRLDPSMNQIGAPGCAAGGPRVKGGEAYEGEAVVASQGELALRSKRHRYGQV